ncbi:hypothetical protein GSF04_21335 [Pseudoalteromonas sp. A22]|uniref:hypothetical protein n=1 Tax=Pseudoalteromonas sp. A22 TaxID=327511 RepID=UPI001BA75258|nr:hypothetical protein [Pseudoalteromonas sp. A22]QUI64883.1 hypothetical protein GSF04_21335 [Pseudoalteromonas sp. A22]
MEDIREILIRHINHRFTVMDVESLLAYKIALFLLLETLPQYLHSKPELLVEYESSTDFLNAFKQFDCKQSVRSRTSLKSALNQLEKAAVVMHQSVRPNEEELEVLELKKKPYLTMYIDLKSLRDEYDGNLVQCSQAHRRLFDEYYLPLVFKLNSLSSHVNMPLLAYQIGLYLIFQLTKEQFEEGQAEFLVESYQDFSEYFSTFVDIIGVPKSTVFDNLFVLSEIGFIESKFLNPCCEFDGNTIEPGQYEDKDHLYIKIPLEGGKY